MAFPRTHSLLTIGGDGWAAAEIWQFGVRFDLATVPTAAEAAITTAVTTWWNAFGPTEYVRLTHWKWALQDTAGDYPAGHVPFEHTYAPALSGNTTNGGAQPQDSIVVSLRTAMPRGRGHAGRIYPPARPVNVGGDGRISSVTTLLTPFVSMFNAIQNAVHAPMVVGSELGGTLRPVTALRMGSVVDTQRRRRNQISENYQEQPITAPSSLLVQGPAATGLTSDDWWLPSAPDSRPSTAFKAALPCELVPVAVGTKYAVLLRPGDASIIPACTTDEYHTMHLGTPLTEEQIAAEGLFADWYRYWA